MIRPTRDFSGTLLTILLTGVSACRPDHRPASPPDAVDRFVLEIEQDGSLALDGKKTARQDTAREFALLADKARSRVKDAGKPLDPKRGLPATIVIWADDRTSFATLCPLMREMPGSGFRLYALAEIGVPRRGRVASPPGRCDAPAGTGKRPAPGDPHAADRAPRR